LTKFRSVDREPRVVGIAATTISCDNVRLGLGIPLGDLQWWIAQTRSKRAMLARFPRSVTVHRQSHQQLSLPSLTFVRRDAPESSQ
jgi:hypothetical protein